MNAHVPPPVREKRKYFTAHSRERAFERYGLKLHATDMLEILRACLDGRAARMLTTTTGEQQFIWTYQGTQIVPVLSSDLSLILTFAPADAFAAGTNLKRFGRKQVPKTPRMAEPDRYNRARENRRAIEEVEE